MTNMPATKWPENFLTDCQYWTEWAHAADVLRRIAAQQPWTRINQMTLRQSLDQAVGYLVQSGVDIRSVWGLDDLVTPEAFAAITQNALAKSSATARNMSLLLLTTAREWVGVDALTMGKLTAIADALPSPDAGRPARMRQSWANARKSRPVTLRPAAKLVAAK